MKQTQAIIISLLIIGIGSRLIPHYPNFTAIGAISLFGAAFGGRRSVAIIIPYLVMLISDMILNNVIYAARYPDDYKFIFLYRGALWSYAAFGLIVMFGYMLFRNNINLNKVLIGATGSSLIFFLLSNFGVWASTGAYPVNFGGLLSCYAAGLPFLLNQFLGDMFYSLVLFGVALHVFMLKPGKVRVSH